MEDRFNGMSVGLNSTGVRHYAITPADDDLPVRPRTLLVVVGGNVVITDEAGTTLTYPNVPAYVEIPIRAVQVNIGTNATVVGID